MFDWYDIVKIVIGAIVAFYFKSKFEKNNRKERDKNILLSNLNFFKAIIVNDIFFFDKQLEAVKENNPQYIVFPLLPTEFDFSKCVEIFKIDYPMGALMIGYMNTRSLWLKVYSSKNVSVETLLHCKDMSSKTLMSVDKRLPTSEKLLERM